jgi:hypothetical protein
LFIQQEKTIGLAQTLNVDTTIMNVNNLLGFGSTEVVKVCQ